MNMRTPPSLLDDSNDQEIVPVIQNQDVDFSEYMWMEEMDEFDRQVEEELIEQDMIEQYFEELFEMEQIATEILSSSPLESAFITFDSSHAGIRTNGLVRAHSDSLSSFNQGSISVVTSKLNPLAPEFVPRDHC